MKTAILILLAGILPLNFSIAQEVPEFEPYWHCEHNARISYPDQAVRTDEGHSCWAQCFPPPPNFQGPGGEGRIHACLDSTRFPNTGLGERACEASLGPVAPCFPSSGGGGGSDSSTKALIAGGVAIAAVAVVKYLAPEVPEGVNIRPEANIAYRDGLAMSTAGIVGGWRNWQFSAVSANTGQGWTKPYARVQWSWVF